MSSRAMRPHWCLRGRCHYFINLTLEPMAMIWVYAGDKPDRIIMDETLLSSRQRLREQVV